MTDLKQTEFAKRFTELTGGCWHKYADFRNPKLVGTGRCTKCGSTEPNPTYSNAADILNRMKEFCGEERYNLFMAQLEFGNSPEVEGIDWSGMIDVAYVENSTALLRKAVGFLEQTKGE